ncbi:RagB/SusD family nutrient uptake outer membrane protein [Formosa sp. PL04]|uniref:RagB/SusD family nutrient uptake outer membrane protein n=1 Tax=Formosa sp. PL04 TaxID=3081755 RepID=UPI002981CB2B|nr:RagB/SusD family nutrient uptake outer membrane protein [Formosa sp. PL04]MDW5290158.1 RagB/SusD family nutrient uptake outer membrane protein [Formosa sp. PL04]
MKKEYKSLVLLTFGLFLFTTSCSLEEEPISEATPDVIYKSVTGIENGVNGTYSILRDIYGSQTGFTLTTFGTDLFRHGKDGGYKAMDMYTSELNSSMSYINNMWTDCYLGINAANTVLDRIDAVADLSEAKKTAFKAEVRFLRAHYYYWLTLQFGDVVLKQAETKGVETDGVRTSKETIWEFMKVDTEFAVSNLDWTSSEIGRVTKGAALHQLVKINLLMKDYSAAEKNGLELIQQGPYQLQNTYAEVFDYNNQVNSEIIFSVQYGTDPLSNGDGNQGHLFFTPAYDQYPGLSRDVTQGGRPFTRFRPTDFFRNLFDENDARFDETFRYTWTYNNAESIPDGMSIGDTVVWEAEDGTFSKIAPNIDKMHWGMKKHDDPTRASFQDQAGFRDFFVSRLSDTYLLVAEALFFQGKQAEAAIYINTIRNRAAKPNTQLTAITASDVTLDFILDERARELGGEAMRWMDLTRTGKLEERVKTYNPNGSNNIKNYHVLRPIPQAQIDLSDVEFPQNPGY